MPNAVLSALVLAVGTVAAAQSLPPAHVALAAPSAAAAKGGKDANYGKRNMAFEQNRGQTDASVRFLSHGSNYSVLVEPAQATLVVHHEQGTAAQRRKALMSGKALPDSQEAIRMSLTGGRTDAPIDGERALAGYVNYISGADRAKDRTGIPTFAAARVRGTYPGIDLLYYGTETQLEYDFLVAPQADPAQIKLHFVGAQPVLTSDGALHLQAGKRPSATDLSFLKPVVYQQLDGQRRPVAGSFNVAKNGEVSFHLGAYDHTRELVIDPIVSYGSYFGGTSTDGINGTTLNAVNQLYAVGQTISLTLPSSAGEFDPARDPNKNNNNNDAFVTKFSADGSTILWTTYLSGSQADIATSVAVGSSDQPYIVGYTNSCGANNGIPGVAPNTAVRFPFTADAIQPYCSPISNSSSGAGVPGTAETNGGSFDAFLVKLSSDGKSELYGTPLGGSNNDFATSVVLDAAGKVYLVGTTSSTSFTDCNGQTRCTAVPNYPGSTGISNYPTTGNAFYSNTSESRLYPYTDPNTGTTSGPTDEQAFITILSPDLHSFVYSSLIGGGVIGGCGNGDCDTNGYAVAVNAAGNAFIGGSTSSAHWPTTAGAFAATCVNAGQSSSQCATTGWAAGFDPTKSGAASLLFSTYMTGATAGKDSNGANLRPGGHVYGLATDSTGNLILTGDTNATDFPTTPGTFSPTCITFGDGNGNSLRCGSIAFLTKFTPAGKTVWSTFFGPTNQNGSAIQGNGLALDANNNVFLLGASASSSLPLKATLIANPLGTDAFISSFTSDAKTLLTSTYLGAGAGIAVNINSLHLDSNLNAYFGGSQGYNTYGGTSFPVTANAPVPNLQGNASGYVVKVITQQQPSATTLAVSPSGPLTPTQTVTLTATVVSASTLTGIPTPPTGTVTFLNGTTTLGTGAIAKGIATYTGMLPAGTDTLTAVYAGDVGFNGSTSPAQVVTVSSAVATSTTVTVNPAAAAFGQTVTLTSTTLAGTTPVTAGTVTFTAGSVTLATAAVGVNGVATTTVTPAVGTYSVVASFTGTASVSNPNGTASSVSAGQTLTVGKAASSVTVSASTALAPVGGSVTFTARVTGTPGSPTGTVNFLNGTTVLGSGTLTAGVATFTFATLPAATYNVSAAYAGDTSFAAATSPVTAPVVIRAAAATTTTLTSSALSAPIKTAITLTATVGTAATTGSPTGLVTFYANGTALGTGTVVNNTATYTTSALPVGAATLTAVYAGDTLFLTSTSNTLTQTTTAPTLSVTATPNPLIIQRGHSGVLTLTLTPSGGFAGTVNFGCGSLPQFVSCVFAPPTLVFTAGSNAAQTDTLTIYTNPQRTAAAHPQQILGLFSRFDAGSLAMLFWLPGSALALFGLRRKGAGTLSKQMKSLVMLVLLVSGLGATSLLSGCASNGNFNVAAPGTYAVPLTITGTDGSVETVNASITVQ